MSKYTMTIDEYVNGRWVHDNPNENPYNCLNMSDETRLEYLKELFPESFPIYDENATNDFIMKFYDAFCTREMSYNTINRWKIRLRSWLNLRMPYYNELYQTRLTDLQNALNDTDITRTEEGSIGKATNTNSTNTSQSTENSENVRTPNLTTISTTNTTDKTYPINGNDYEGHDKEEIGTEQKETGTNTDAYHRGANNTNQYYLNSESADVHDMTYKTKGFAGINKVSRTKEFRDLIFSINDLIFEEMKKSLFMRIL